MKNLLPLIILLLLLLNCETVSDKFARTIGAEDLARLEKIELRLLDYQFNGDSQILEQAENELLTLLEQATYSKEYEAKIYGLLAEVYFYKQDQGAAKKYLEQIEYTYSSEERYFVVKALLEKNPESKLEILDNGLTLADATALIKLNMAEVYFSMNNYRKAAAFYDEALTKLHTNYRQYFEKKRDLAYQFIEAPPENIAAQDIVAIDVLNVKNVLTFILLETNFFDNITVQKDLGADLLLFKIKEVEYIYDKNLLAGDPCLRKDVAYLLLNILAYLENDKTLLTKYSEKFKESGMDSPVPDVKVADYYFNAVLILVEREIMNLPDGINFSPSGIVSGLELSEIIKKMKMQ